MTRLAAVAALAMVVSLFVPWLVLPLGPLPTPYEVFQQMNEAVKASDIGWVDFLSEMAGQSGTAFFGSTAFALTILLAAIFGVLGLAGAFPRGVRLLIGGLAGIIALFAWVRIQGQMNGLREALGTAAPDNALSLAMDYLGAGAYLYFGGAAVVLLLGLLQRRG
jgi:hypothetical protein